MRNTQTDNDNIRLIATVRLNVLRTEKTNAMRSTKKRRTTNAFEGGTKKTTASITISKIHEETNQ